MTFTLRRAICLGMLLCAGAPTASHSQSPISDLKFSREARLRYNRVEGVFAGYRLDVTPARKPGLTFFAQSGYGVDIERVRWEAGFKMEERKWTLAGAIFDRTASNDEDIVRSGENTLYMLFFKGDYRDYFRAKYGFDLRGDYELRRNLRGVAGLSAFTYEPLAVRQDWSIFRSDDSARVNPAVRAGDAGVFRTGLVFDNRRLHSPIFRNAWLLTAFYERGFREFPYNGLILGVRRYQKLIFGKQAVVIKAMAGSRESLDEQHLFDIGGISTLRGYRIKEYSGNRVLLANAEYLFNGDLFGRIPIKGAHMLEFILFADAGWVTSVPKSATLLDGFDGFTLDDVKTNVGAAVSLYRQLVRVNVARRLDDDIDDWTFSIRFKREL